MASRARPCSEAGLPQLPDELLAHVVAQMGSWSSRADAFGVCKAWRDEVRRYARTCDPYTALLTEEQQGAFEQAVLRRRSLFLTGGAGVGKTYAAGAIVRALRGMLSSSELGVANSTRVVLTG